ncbi:MULTISPECIES: hypothetical protein [unclassified Azospirillum]|uniref:hypothetical protein n=1 Tax=unclassified Azospirillum TaxID=2630922 RepID=UPI0011B1EA56|nr:MULTISPECIES: hypothetical protein [unclassified Azospirillum]
MDDPTSNAVRLPTCGCPYCGATLSGATEVTGKRVQPKAGDFTLCAYCGALCVFKENGTVRRPVRSEQREADRDPLLVRARQAFARHPLELGGKGRLH